MHTLSSGDLAADWLPEHGMVGASLRHRGEELLGQRGGLPDYLARGAAFGIPLLAPWANRLDGLRYGDVELDPALVKGGADGLPKDGAMAGRAWQVLAAEPARLLARHVAGEAVMAVFPFPHAYEVEVTLTPERMTVATTLEATGEVAVPVSFGWHPLFRLPGVGRDALEVELPVALESVLDARGIPTGEQVATAWRAGPLGAAEIDAEFPAGDGDFVLRGGGRELRVGFGGPDFPIGHAWSPVGADFVAWEPMTAPTNALVSGDGLRLLAPGERFSASFWVAVR